MDRFTPAVSFRTGRPLTRNKPRPRPMSPSPIHRRFAESSPSMFITTDYDLFSPSSPDSDLYPIFHMSPVHSHFYPPPLPNTDPVNVINLCHTQKTQQQPASPRSPPLSPLLYSFPRPSFLHPYMNKTADGQKHILSKPLSAISQNKGVPTIDRRLRPISVKDEEENLTPPGVQPLSLTASLLDIPLKMGTKSRPTSECSSPSQFHGSSPIPIPRHTPRQSDSGVYDLNPPSLPLSIASVSATQAYAHNPTPIYTIATETPLPSSGVNSFPYTQPTQPQPHVALPLELESIQGSPLGSIPIYPHSASVADPSLLLSVQLGMDEPERQANYEMAAAALHQDCTCSSSSSLGSPPSRSISISISPTDQDPFRFSHYMSDSRSPSIPSVSASMDTSANASISATAGSGSRESNAFLLLKRLSAGGRRSTSRGR